MKTPLNKVNKKINIENYSLKDLAEYFEKFNNYLCIITTETKIIKFKIYKDSLPHLIGLHHIYKNKYYKGINGFQKLKNEKITIQNIKKVIYSKTNKDLVENILNRIEYLPMFFNTIQTKTKLKNIDKNKTIRNTLLKGNYALYKNSSKNIYPLLSIKNINKNLSIIETFIIENNISLLGALKSEKILNIELIAPKILLPK